MNVRILVKLEIKPPFVVKPVYFEGLRKVGSPVLLANKYYEQGADEILYIDIVSSLYQRNIVFDIIKETADNLFIPFSVGGGVKTIEDFSELFHIGADKVVINTYAIQNNPNIINAAAKIFGKQAVVVNIEVKEWDHFYECYSDSGKIGTGKELFSWIKEVVDRGAGEILLQSIDRDGAKNGFDIELAKMVVDSVNIPVVISSGAGELKDIKELIEYAKPSGVAISSILHDNDHTIKEIKKYLSDNGIKVSK